MQRIPFFFFFNDTAPTEIYTLSLHDALPIFGKDWEQLVGFVNLVEVFHATKRCEPVRRPRSLRVNEARSEEHTSELQSLRHLVCRLLLEKNTPLLLLPCAPNIHFRALRGLAS